LRVALSSFCAPGLAGNSNIQVGLTRPPLNQETDPFTTTFSIGAQDVLQILHKPINILWVCFKWVEQERPAGWIEPIWP
jgi:hypothetical protein